MLSSGSNDFVLLRNRLPALNTFRTFCLAPMANGQREARLAVCRRLLLVVNATAALPGVETAPLTPAPPPCCPHCGGTRLVYRALVPLEPTPTAVRPDSS